MSEIISFIQQNGTGLGTVTAYSAVVIYHFLIIPSTLPMANLFILAAFIPALLIYELTKEFTGLIIGELLGQHVAIARAKLELQQGGEFEDWYQDENIDKIDKRDRKSREELITAISALFIGISSPFVGWFSFHIEGVIVGLLISAICLFTILYALRQIAQTIERTPRVVQT